MLILSNEYGQESDLGTIKGSDCEWRSQKKLRWSMNLWFSCAVGT